MKTLLVDLSRCNGCYNCQIVCKDEHCENDWSPYALPQPQTGQFWCRVDQEERGRVPVVRVAYTPKFCGMCDDAPCLAVAKDGAVYRREDGIVVIDPEKAKGQRELVDACPQGMIFWNAELDVAQKCTGCAHLLDNGWAEPRCVDACATDALRLVDEDDPEFTDLLASAAASEELGGLGSHVRYLNVPKRWIAGTVADRTKNEVVIGAQVTILNAEGKQVATLETDDFGDFKYDFCDKAVYTVLIEAEGYGSTELTADCTQKDVVFDDIFADRFDS